ncbi:MAG: transaldolase [Gammaproteobacteria bacterium]
MTTTANSIRAALALGQSIWYDNIQRAMLTRGELARLITEDGLRGLTSNPTIFEKAITGSSDYDQALQDAVRGQSGVDSETLFYALAIDDITAAADLLRPVYDASGSKDGMVSIEVSPDLAHDTAGTVAQALRLHERIARPNLMIKVPATPAGLPAIEQLIDAGISVNVTLLFSVQRYLEVIEAYLLGLESRLRRGQPIDTIASVASFFVSRVDSAVDKLLEQRMADADPQQSARLAALQGKIAIANAKRAYQEFKSRFGDERFDKLRKVGAQVQRLLWASTGTKNPAYRDVLYLEALIGADTVNTVPPDTYRAFLDHGCVAPTLEQDIDGANAALTELANLGIDLTAITQQLETEGVASFAQSYHHLLDAIKEKTASVAQYRSGT